MDQLDDLLADFFKPAAMPPSLAARLTRRPAALDSTPDASRFHLEATDRGLRRVQYGSGRDEAPTSAARKHLERGRAELGEYLAGARTYFSVPVDLEGIGEFQARVLSAAARIPYEDTTSYAELARRIGHPRASRAVGNALGANPVPIVIPCHRIIRGDGSWGHYVFGGPMKTALLSLERTTPALVGSATTRIVCRKGCSHEQRIDEAHRVVFASVEDARSVGYRPCKVCQR